MTGLSEKHLDLTVVGYPRRARSMGPSILRSVISIACAYHAFVFVSLSTSTTLQLARLYHLKRQYPDHISCLQRFYTL